MIAQTGLRDPAPGTKFALDDHVAQQRYELVVEGLAENDPMGWMSSHVNLDAGDNRRRQRISQCQPSPKMQKFGRKRSVTGNTKPTKSPRSPADRPRAFVIVSC